jgi:hypothetical protein
MKLLGHTMRPEQASLFEAAGNGGPLGYHPRTIALFTGIENTQANRVITDFQR